MCKIFKTYKTYFFLNKAIKHIGKTSLNLVYTFFYKGYIF